MSTDHEAPPPGPLAADPEARAAAASRRARAITRVQLRLLMRNGENLLVAFGLPLGLLVLLALTDTGLGVADGPAPAVAAAATASVLASGLVALPIVTAFERDALALKRLGASPLRGGELVAGKLTAFAVLLAGQLLAVGLVGLAVGWRPPASPVALTLALVVIVAGAAACSGAGLALAGRLPAMRTLAVTNATFALLLATSGLVVALEALPGALAALVGLLPAAPLLAVLSALLDPAQGLAAVSLGSLGVLAAWAVVAPVVAVRLFRWWDE